MRGYRQDKINQILDLPGHIEVPERERPQSPNSKNKNIFRLKKMKSTSNIRYPSQQGNFSETQGTFISRRTEQNATANFDSVRSSIHGNIPLESLSRYKGQNTNMVRQKARMNKNVVKTQNAQDQGSESRRKNREEVNKYSTSQGFFQRNKINRQRQITQLIGASKSIEVDYIHNFEVGDSEENKASEGTKKQHYRKESFTRNNQNSLDKKYIMDSKFYSRAVFDNEKAKNPDFYSETITSKIRDNFNQLESVKNVQSSNEDMKRDQAFKEDSKKLDNIINKQRNHKRRQNAAYIKMMLMETGVSYSNKDQLRNSKSLKSKSMHSKNLSSLKRKKGKSKFEKQESTTKIIEQLPYTSHLVRHNQKQLRKTFSEFKGVSGQTQSNQNLNSTELSFHTRRLNPQLVRSLAMQPYLPEKNLTIELLQRKMSQQYTQPVPQDSIKNVKEVTEKPTEAQEVKVMRNISYLFQGEDEETLYRPKKPTPIDLMKPEDMTLVKSTNLEDVRAILDAHKFPTIGNSLFEVLSDMKMSYKERKIISSKWKRTKPQSADLYELTNKRISNLLESNKIHACYERNESLASLKWLELMKKLYNKSGSKNDSEESYFQNFKDILGFCYRELIANESKRCKEKSLLLEKLYNENIEYFDNMMSYIQLYLKVLDKNHKNDIDQIIKDFTEQIEEMQFEFELLKQKYDALFEENEAFHRKTAIMRSKLANDYLVLKHLRGDLGYAEDCLAITKSENRKISKVITSMNKEIQQKDFNFTMDSIFRFRNKFKHISKIQENATVEIHMIETTKNNFEMNQTMELTNVESRHLNKKMGANFEGDEKLLNFKTREYGIQCTGFIKPKEKGIQHAPLEYKNQSQNVDIYVCHVCEMLRKENTQLLSEFKDITRLKSEAEVEIEKLKVENQTLLNNLDDEKSKFDDLLKNRVSFNREDIQIHGLPSERSGSGTLLLDSERIVGPAHSMNLDDINLDKSSLSGMRLNSFAYDQLNQTKSISRESFQDTFNLVDNSALYNTHNTTAKESNSLTNWDLSIDFIFGADDSYQDLDPENEEHLQKIDEVVPEDMRNLSKTSAIRIKDIYQKLKTKLQVIEEENLNEDGEPVTMSTARQNDVDKLKNRVNHYWSLILTFLKHKKVDRGSKSELIKKRTRKIGSSTKLRKLSNIVVNQAKKRNNRLISQANKLFNSVLQNLNDNIKISKSFLMRDKTLIKQIFKTYLEMQTTLTRDTSVAFNLQLFKFLSLSISHKKLQAKNYKSVISTLFTLYLLFRFYTV